MFPIDAGGGIELHLINVEDAPELRLLIDGNRDYLREWLPWVDGSRTVEDVVDFIRRTQDQHDNNDGFGAVIRTGGTIAGVIGVHRIDWLNRSTSIGYWLDAGHQGRGIMTAACRAVLAHVFLKLALHRVEIRCGTGNHKSCAIPRRLGFRLEGVLREAEWVNDRFVDLNVFSLLAPEFKK